MSQDCSRSKFDGVREKLSRFRREYFCMGSSEHLGRAARGTRPDVGEDSRQLPALISGRTDGHRRSCDGGKSAMTNGDRSTLVEDGHQPARRHSVPSRFVSIPESREEVDLVVATPVSVECRPARDVAYTIPVLTSAVDSSVDHSLSTENDNDDYDEFVRGLQSSYTVTMATVFRQELSSEAAEIHARTVRRSRQRPVGVQGTTASYSVGRKTFDPSERRSLGGKLMRTLRKTFSSAALGKNDEVEDSSLSVENTRPTSSSAFDKQSSYLLPTPFVENVESIQSTRRLDKDSVKSEWQPLAVSSINLLEKAVVNTVMPFKGKW